MAARSLVLPGLRRRSGRAGSTVATIGSRSRSGGERCRTAAVSPAPDGALERFLADTAEARLESFKALLRIPSISGIPAHAPDCRAAAEFVAADMRSAGLEHVEVCETGGHPVVYADWLHAAGKPTILVYAHYDVQPVDPIELWDSPPFVPVVKDGRMLARGASDCKCHVSMHMRAVEALIKTARQAAAQPQVRDRGRGGVELGPSRRVAGGQPRRASPATWRSSRTRASSRGTCPPSRRRCGASSTSSSTSSAATSTSTPAVYGGAVDNPINALCHIVAVAQGPGRHASSCPASTTTSCRSRGSTGRPSRLCRSTRRSIASRWGSPTLHRRARLHRLSSGSAPAPRSTSAASGAVSRARGPRRSSRPTPTPRSACRLVANQDPEKIFELVRDHIAKVAPKTIRWAMQRLGDGRPSLTPIESPATQAAARALKATFGVDPLYIREGGSVPVCASFETILGVSTVLLGLRPGRRPASTRPTSGCGCPTTRPGSGRSRATGTSWRRWTGSRGPGPEVPSPIGHRPVPGRATLLRWPPKPLTQQAGGTCDHQRSPSREHRRRRSRQAGASTRTTAASSRGRLSTSWSISTRTSPAAGSASTSRCRWASACSTRRSAAACARAS